MNIMCTTHVRKPNLVDLKLNVLWLLKYNVMKGGPIRLPEYLPSLVLM